MDISGRPVGHIQCLILNIYVPYTANQERYLPVMVYIHGGAFIEGSGSFIIGTPKYLIERDVIVVSINYRLGIYGFMCTDNPKAPGNIGLKDQLIALRWIDEHIEDFGGDRSRITVFGEDAGAMSVHLHLLSDHEKLFSQAIIQSGPATSPWTMGNINNSVPLRISQLLGFITNDVEDAIDFIAAIDVHQVIFAGASISTSEYSTESLTKPCIESEFNGIERFVTVNPNVATSDKIEKIAILIGITSQEMIYQHVKQDQQFYNDYSFKGLLELGFDVSDFDEMCNTIRHFYLGENKPSKSFENEITSFASDFIFNHPTKRAIDLFLRDDARVIYYYVFSYVGDRSLVTIENSSLIGASHADNINYLFAAGTLTNFDIISAADKLMIKRMTAMWTNFAKYGNPTPETTELLPVLWEPVTRDRKPYLNIDRELTLKHSPFHERLAFWDLFYDLNDGYTLWNCE